ncbi:ABC transporter permease [Emticicia sp. BO119]|nr:ABC transporter permease [Emticicia sp. BO119]
MISNYFTIAWRNIHRNKAFSAINIMGLALGMACSLLILLWIQDELSVDNYHANGKQLYKLRNRQYYDGKIVDGDALPGMIADEMKRQFPEINYAANLTWEEKMTFSVGDKANKELGRWAGEDWFKMFSVPLLGGNPKTALNAPNNIAISRKIAENYFGSAQAAMGKAIRINDKKDYQVTAVFENLPQNTSAKYDFLLNWYDALEKNTWMKSWGNNATFAFIMVRPDANPANLDAKMRYLMRKLVKDMNPKEYDIHFTIQAFNDAYLYSNYENGKQAGGRIEYVRLFGLVGIFLLLIACINFMNLATARSARRSREVGVRKVMGAKRGSLVGQFVGEAVLFTFLALFVAVIMVIIILPGFNTLTGKQISLNINQPSFWLILFGMACLTGVVSGSYPALFLSSLNPVRVLKGALKFGAGARLFRQSLVVFQFVLSMLLIVGTIVVYRQIDYLQTKNLGYDRENLIYIPAEGELGPKYLAFKNEILQKPGIQSVTFIGSIPTRINNGTTGVSWPGKDPNIQIDFSNTNVGYDFAKVMKLKLEGRDFSKAYGTDSVNYLVNESAVKRIGYTDPIGKPLTLWGIEGKIIGVLEDFHFQSLHEPIKPLIVRFTGNIAQRYIMVRTQPGQVKEAINSLESVTKQMNPKFPLTYTFANDEYMKLYMSESIISGLANYFAFIAIFISCLGLFGLSAFMAEQRTKEIGVRKVLGASVLSVVRLLSGDFLKLVLIAIIIAAPLAWYVMSRWMENFSYKVGVEWWVFVLSGIMAIIIALLTVSFQSIKAALLNPVKSLKSE